MSKTLTLAGLLMLLFPGPGPALAAPDDARAILVEAENRNRSRSQEHFSELIVTARNGKERRKICWSYREGYGGNANRLIRFVGPAEVRGVGFLSLARPGQLPDRWMYLPSMKRERRLAPQEQEGSFVGTDFSYEDLQEFDHSKYDVTQLADQTLDGQACYVIDLAPRERSAYTKKTLFLQKDTLCPVRIELVRKGDRGASKRLDLADYTPVDGHQTATRLVMSDLRRGSRTTILLTEIAFDRPQPADRYTIQNLIREGDDGVPAPKRDGRSRVEKRQLFALSSAQTDPAAQSTTPWGVTGYVEALGLGFFGVSNDRDPQASSWNTLLLRKSARLGRVRFLGSVRAQQISSSEQGSVAVDLADRRARRSPITLLELSAVVPLRPALDLQAGRFEVAWGRTLLYSPADAFLPRDASDPFSEEKLPLWGVRLQGERGPIRFELYTSLVTTPWRLPPMDGRYSPFSAFQVYLLANDARPPVRGFENIRFVHTGPRWQIGGWMRAGVRPAPILDPNVDLSFKEESALFVPVERRYARETGVGVELSRNIDLWTVRGEVALSRSRDPVLGDTIIWSAEAERAVRSGVMTFTAAGNTPQAQSAPLLVFDRAYLPAYVISSTQAESWGSWTISDLGTIRKIGGIVKAQVARELTDSVKLTVGIDLPYGATLDSPGAFRDVRKARAALRWSW